MNDEQTPSSSDAPKTNDLRKQFTVMALNMSWQLAVIVLLPVIGGVELDKALHTSEVWLFAGLAVAALGTVAVLWRAVQTANKLPVPKLTDEQRRAIRKSYEDEEKEEL